MPAMVSYLETSPVFLGRGVPLSSPNVDPISDHKMSAFESHSIQFSLTDLFLLSGKQSRTQQSSYKVNHSLKQELSRRSLGWTRGTRRGEAREGACIRQTKRKNLSESLLARRPRTCLYWYFINHLKVDTKSFHLFFVFVFVFFVRMAAYLHFSLLESYVDLAQAELDTRLCKNKTGLEIRDTKIINL